MLQDKKTSCLNIWFNIFRYFFVSIYCQLLLSWTLTLTSCRVEQDCLNFTSLIFGSCPIKEKNSPTPSFLTHIWLSVFRSSSSVWGRAGPAAISCWTWCWTWQSVKEWWTSTTVWRPSALVESTWSRQRCRRSHVYPELSVPRHGRRLSKWHLFYLHTHKLCGCCYEYSECLALECYENCVWIGGKCKKKSSLLHLSSVRRHVHLLRCSEIYISKLYYVNPTVIWLFKTLVIIYQML